MKLSVYDVYKQDEKYQQFMGEFNKKKSQFEEMANLGVYKKEHLQELAKKLHEDLKKFLLNHRTEQLKTREERMSSLEKKKQKFGLAERKDEVKEFEMRFKLADDFEIKRMVETLDTTDLLELNLLRMELKSRGLDKEDVSGRNYDAKVKHYIMQNNLDGMDPADKQEYDRLQEEAVIYRSMGAGFVVGESNFKHIDSIQHELTQTANKVVNEKKTILDVPTRFFN